MRLRLLERLELLSQGAPVSPSPKPETLVKSLASHLSAILSSRPMSSLAAEGYGLPDPLAFEAETGPEGLRELEKVLAATIKKYEPRLLNPKATCRPQTEDLNHLVFTITGDLGPLGPGEVALTARLSPDGRIQVSR
ncbi:MAG: type VI secretion system baseplate subunit TssE [Deltaproteobacteria bacterium]|jgi:type VI secretion system protein|nr:type VI secretion system baseplate subunit TssE [Deltaproteobacteria bacterium]